MLDIVQQTLAGLAGPSGSRVGDLGLLAAQVGVEVLGGNGSLLTEPEEALLVARDQAPDTQVRTGANTASPAASYTHLMSKPWCWTL